MKIDAARDGGATVLRLAGRLDREWAEHLSGALENLIRSGARSLVLDFAGVTYVSSAGASVLTRCQQELAALRGEVRLSSISPAVREMLAIAGWDERGEAAGSAGPAADLRLSSWHLPAVAVRCGEYQTSACVPGGVLSCRLLGPVDGLVGTSVGQDDCEVVEFPPDVLGLGVGAIGGGYHECRERLGELMGVAGCVAYFPSDGARLADYLVGRGAAPPRAVLASGLTCQGAFSTLVRFSPRSEAEPVPLSELVSVCLNAVSGQAAGMVIAAETAGLTGTRLRRSPATDGAATVRFELPGVREWLSFAPERIHPRTTALIVGVVAREPQAPLAARLRPLGGAGRLYGHFHAAVFSYRPLPQRTVELHGLLQALFQQHRLRDVLHLLWDDRGSAGVGESALLRGVAWVGPIAQVV